MKDVLKKINNDSEIVLSRNKAIIFAIIIDILTSFIISIGAYDIIISFYGTDLVINKAIFMTALFPGVFVIIGTILISYVIISLKWKNFDTKKTKKKNKAK